MRFRPSVLLMAVLAGCEPPKEAGKATEPEPPKSAAVPKQPKKEPPKKSPSDPTPLPHKPSDPPKGDAKPLTFADAWYKAVDALPLMRADARKAFEEKKKILTADEAELLSAIMSKYGEAGRMTTTEMLVCVRHGMADFIAVVHATWGSREPGCRPVAETIWARTPKTRSPTALGTIMLRWAMLDDKEREAFPALLQEVEGRKREFTTDDRDRVIKVAGEEYWANRP